MWDSSLVSKTLVSSNSQPQQEANHSITFAVDYVKHRTQNDLQYYKGSKIL